MYIARPCMCIAPPACAQVGMAEKRGFSLLSSRRLFTTAGFLCSAAVLLPVSQACALRVHAACAPCALHGCIAYDACTLHVRTVIARVRKRWTGETRDMHDICIYICTRYVCTYA